MNLGPERPTLHTPRLILRPFDPSDAPEVQRLAGDFAIADTTLNVPHPYEDGMAEAWIASLEKSFSDGRGVVFAIVRREDGALCGSVGLSLNARHANAELGYWVGVPFQNRGICTEAARAVLDYGFHILQLHRVHSSHLARNPASGRVMQKLGMTREGCRRDHVRKWDRFEDLVLYGVLASEVRAAEITV